MKRLVILLLLLCGSIAYAQQKMQFAFSSGELSPQIAGRVDLQKYYNGVETMLNTIVLPTGGGMRRPGLEYIANARYTETTAELIPFEFNTEQAYVLEFGNEYMRVFADGGQVFTPDDETKLLMHFDGVDGSQVFTDSSQSARGNATVYSSVSVSTAQQVFGTGSYYTTTSSPGYISYTDSDDWYMGTEPFTIDFWVFFKSFAPAPNSDGFFQQKQDDDNMIWFRYRREDKRIRATMYNNGGISLWGSGFKDFSLVTWYHIAFIKGWDNDNTKLAIVVDGESLTTLTSSASWGDYSDASFDIGMVSRDGNHYIDGYIDEFRVSKGVARWTENFARPDQPYPIYDGDDSGEEYQISTPYLAGHLKDLRYCQSADTMYITHEAYTPTTLTRTDHDAWTLTDQTFDEDNWPPFQAINTTTTTLATSATSGSIGVTASAALFNNDSLGTFYQMAGGFFRVDAYTSTTRVTGTVIDDLTSGAATTSWYEGAWSIRRGWPGTVNFFEERLWYGGSPNQPMTLWASASSDFDNFSTQAGSSIVDTDGLNFTIASNTVNAIMWTQPTKKFLIGTTGGEYWLSGQTTNEAVSPTSILVRRETEYGSAQVDAAGIGEETFFLQRPGKIIRGFGFDWRSDSYIGSNLSLLANHLTRSTTITDLVHQPAPYGILWGLRSDGDLLGLTYLKDQEVVGWHHHVTEGDFEAITSIPGATEDEVWVIVKRNIEGVDYRYVERFAVQFDGTLANATNSDSYLTYNGTAATTISGYTHLEGERIQILADGDYLGMSTVVASAISFTPAATVVTSGLPYTSTIKTMRIAKGDGAWQGLTKKIARVITRFFETVECDVGPNEDKLDAYSFTDATLFSGDKRVNGAQFKDDILGQVVLRQTDPYPWTILGIMQDINSTEK